MTTRGMFVGTRSSVRKGATVSLLPANAIGILLAFLSRPCCVLPALLSLLGLSYSGLVSLLEPYRVWLMTAAAACLAISAFFTFRPSVTLGARLIWLISAGLSALLLFLH